MSHNRGLAFSIELNKKLDNYAESALDKANSLMSKNQLIQISIKFVRLDEHIRLHKKFKTFTFKYSQRNQNT